MQQEESWGKRSAVGNAPGIDMNRWPTEKHFVFWLDLCPLPKISGGHVIGQTHRHAQNRAGQRFRQATSALNCPSATELCHITRAGPPALENPALKPILLGSGTAGRDDRTGSHQQRIRTASADSA